MDWSEIWQRIQSWFNDCEIGTDAQNLRDAISNAEHAMHAAEVVSEFRRINSNTAANFRQAREALSSVSGSLDAIETICLDVQAIRRIRHASQVLGEPGAIRRDPRAASRAFGELFQGFGQLAGHLPPPANAYNQILIGLGNGFFENVSRGLDPSQRWSREFDAIERESNPNVRGMQ